VQTRDQMYATNVYKKVTKTREEEKDYKKYGGFSNKLPILIRTAGLAQALSFVEARGNKPGERLLRDLADTIGKVDMITLTKAAREVQLSEYIRLTQQVMDALLWYKRFAQSILGVEQDQATEVAEERSGEEE